MALTTIQSNNKLIEFTRQINREFVRENLFNPYMGDELNAIIRRRYEPKQGGEQMNVPIVTKLRNQAQGVGTLVGNEENVDNYGMRIWIDWARNAVITNKAECLKDSADLFGEFKPLLSNWGKELIRDEIIAAFMALPSESAPTLLGSAGGGRSNGIQFEAATAAQKATWANTDNLDRVVFGALLSNQNATFATALGNCDTTNDIQGKSNLSLMKRMALNASPAIRPYKTKDGYEYYVCFMGSNCFRDLKADLVTVQTTALQQMIKQSPLFQDGDLIWDGIIVRQVPEISGFVSDIWTTLLTAGASSTRVEPAFLCGQQSLTIAFGQMARPTVRKEDDYGFLQGVGVEMAYGTAKMFKKHPSTGTALVQWGVVTHVAAAQADG